MFELADARRIAVRPSGTESKIKFYLFAKNSGVSKDSLVETRASSRRSPGQSLGVAARRCKKESWLVPCPRNSMLFRGQDTGALRLADVS